MEASVIDAPPPFDGIGCHQPTSNKGEYPKNGAQGNRSGRRLLSPEESSLPWLPRVLVYLLAVHQGYCQESYSRLSEKAGTVCEVGVGGGVKEVGNESLVRSYTMRAAGTAASFP